MVDSYKSACSLIKARAQDPNIDPNSYFGRQIMEQARECQAYEMKKQKIRLKIDGKIDEKDKEFWKHNVKMPVRDTWYQVWIIIVTTLITSLSFIVALQLQEPINYIVSAMLQFFTGAGLEGYDPADFVWEQYAIIGFVYFLIVFTLVIVSIKLSRKYSFVQREHDIYTLLLIDLGKKPSSFSVSSEIMQKKKKN